jgi:poly(glycerol-phosphate) alpha-glucosyltransferase
MGLKKRLLFLTASVSQAGGGIFVAVQRLSQHLFRRREFSVRVLGLKDAYTDQDLGGWKPLKPGIFPVLGPRAFGYAPDLRAALRDADPHLLHTHGLWMYPSLAALSWARQRGKPTVISPHGMLEAWALRNSWLKKKLAGWLFEREHLERASCLHALCLPELRSLRGMGFKNAICVVPNGVDLPKEGNPADFGKKGLPQSAIRNPQSEDGRKVLLYLGRLHPKKGLHNLIQALAILRQRGSAGAKSWRLVVAGWDQRGTSARLKRQVHDMDLEDGVTFMGPQFGLAKAAVFRSADAFILPSYSEGLPLVVLEAWAHRLPVLMTEESNLPEGFVRGAARCIEPDPESMAESLDDFFSAPGHQRRAMGRAGRRLVEADFSWPSVAARMRQVYHWLLGGGARPVFVDL